MRGNIWKLFGHLPFEGVDCEWGAWSHWSSCSQTCGGGFKTKNRSIVTVPQNGGSACTGNNVESEQCNTQLCGKQRKTKLLLQTTLEFGFIYEDISHF